MTEAITSTISRINGNCITLGKENLFINNVDISGFNEFDTVSYTKSGQNLQTITKFIPPATPAETKKGGGKITVLDLLNSTIEYSYFWQGATATGKIYKFSDEVKPKLGGYHVGDEVSLTWTVSDGKKTLIDIGPKQVKKGGGGRPFDPVAAAKKQEFEDRKQVLIVRQSCLDRSVSLWVNGNPGKVPTDADDEMILSRMEKYAERVMRQ